MEDNKDFDKDEQGQDTQQMPRVPAEGEEDGKKGTIVLFGREVSKKKVAMAGLGGLLALALIGGGAWYAMSREPQDAKPPVQQAEKQERPVIRIGAKADGWVKGESSPVIAHIVNEDEKVDYYHAYDANVAVELDVPADGDYKVSFITPVNKDGSIYEVPAETAVKAEAVKKGEKGDGEGTLPFTFKPIEADKATADALSGVAGDVAEAVKKGDETLTGEVGGKVVELVKRNLKANPAADAEKVEQESQKAEESVGGPSDGEVDGGSDSGNGGDGGAGGSAGGTGGQNGQNQGSVAGGDSDSGGTGNGGGESKPQHTHNWVAETTVVHHDAVYETTYIHHDAVVEYHCICNGCGADITGFETSHFKENFFNGCQSYTNTPVTVKEAWDEPVQQLVKDAYDEEVPTGRYICSCGAVK